MSCRYHLYLDITYSGSVHINVPGLEVWELGQTCALDVAEKDGVTLDEVADIMGLTRERVRQIEMRALSKYASELDDDGGQK